MTAPRRRGGRAGRASRPLALVWTDRARDDLQAIGDYIAAERPVAAKRWVDRLVAAVEAAAAMPFAGRIVPEKGREDVREVVRRTYRIVYRVRERQMEVLTIFEGHRRFPDDAVPGDED